MSNTLTPNSQPETRGEILELEKLLVFLRGGNFHQPRADRWRHNIHPVEVEPAYVMGEASMTLRFYNDKQHPGKHTALVRFTSPFGSLDLLQTLREALEDFK